MKITKVGLNKIANFVSVDSIEEGYTIFETQDKSETFSTLTSSEICKLLDGLIGRLKDTDAPNEEEGIGVLSGIAIQELGIRIMESEGKKTQRNKLIRYLRNEIERLKK